MKYAEQKALIPERIETRQGPLDPSVRVLELKLLAMDANCEGYDPYNRPPPPPEPDSDG